MRCKTRYTSVPIQSRLIKNALLPDLCQVRQKQHSRAPPRAQDFCILGKKATKSFHSSLDRMKLAECPERKKRKSIDFLLLKPPKNSSATHVICHAESERYAPVF